MTRVADIVAQTLAHHGTRHAFGIPGGEVLTLIDALEAAGIRFVLTRQETSAAIMAAATATLTGSPGLLVTTLGPGLASAVNGIADASQEHMPLIVISGVVDHPQRNRYTHQVIDHAALLHPLVKKSFEIEPDGVGATLERAIRLATTPPQGPVHLDLSPSTAAARAQPNDRATMPTRATEPLVSRDDRCISHIRTKLEAARRPLIIAGYEAVRSGCDQALATLVERWRIPVLTSYKAKGLLPENHPCALGAAGLSPLADTSIMQIISAADCILLLGYDPIEMRQGWLNPFPASADVVELTRHTPDHGMHRVDMRLIAPLPESLAAITPQTAPANPVWSCDRLRTARDALKRSFSTPAQWGPHAIVDVLEQSLTSDTIVTVDSGAHRILLSQKLKLSKPHTLLQSAGFCTMGAAIPLAAGAKLAQRRASVIAVVGDGGIEMGLGELATLRDENLPVVVVVLQDESLALIELKQRAAGLNRAGVRLGPTRLEDVATAFGGNGIRVKSADELQRALANGLTQDNFSVIVCEIEASAYEESI